MTEITLHGIVAKKFKKSHRFANIGKPTDAFKAIDANNPGFLNFFKNSAEKNQYYEMIVNGNVVKNAQDATQRTEIKTIEIVPCVAGSDPVTMLVVFAVNLVIGLVMAGIQYLMTPIPEEEPKNAVAQTSAKSFFFSNRQNVSKQFVPVPVGYGYMRVGSKIIESYIEPVDLNDNDAQQEFNMNGSNTPDFADGAPVYNVPSYLQNIFASSPEFRAIALDGGYSF